MEVHDAASRLSEIHAQLLKSEVFRGYRSWPMLSSGLLALLGAVLQATVIPPASAHELALFWLAVAAVAGSICFGDLAFGYQASKSASDRRRTRNALGQFLPSLMAGIVVSVLLLDSAPQLLPGLWSLFFALALFSSRLHLPRQIGWVALWYLFAGSVLLSQAGSLPTAWGMGLCFGLGQLALAWVFYSSIERRHDDCA